MAEGIAVDDTSPYIKGEQHAGKLITKGPRVDL